MCSLCDIEILNDPERQMKYVDPQLIVHGAAVVMVRVLIVAVLAAFALGAVVAYFVFR